MAESQARHSRLLVIDDEPMMLRAIQRWLAGEFEMAATTDSREAVARVSGGERFDAILCDLMMPILSGMDVYEAIRRVDADQARRIIFMTGGAFAPKVLEFLASVPNARVEKPLERSLLHDAIRSLSG
jgi:CheY-like chemotaxis protein